MTYVILCEGAKLVDYKQLKREIIDYAHSIGIDSIGFTTADPFDELKQKLESYHSKGFASGFEESDIALRTEPKLSLPSARSIIAIAVGYPNKLKGAPKSVRGDRRGMLRELLGVKIIIQLCVKDLIN